MVLTNKYNSLKCILLKLCNSRVPRVNYRTPPVNYRTPRFNYRGARSRDRSC